MLGDEWQEFFDVVVTSAGKPGFYAHDATTRFRSLDSCNTFVKWNPATDAEMKKKRVLVGGSVTQLTRLAGWEEERILYFGDSLVADILEPRRAMGWATGAIVRELEHEMEVHASPEFKLLRRKADAVEDLVRELTVDAYHGDEGDSTADELTGLLDALEKEKRSLVAARDSLFNKYFGSIFRAGYGDVSMYGSTLKRSTDIYTDRLDRLLGYSPNHRFYPPSYRRRLERLPHERRDGAYEKDQ